MKLDSLVKVEWRKYYPVLVVHERFEKYVKWGARIMALIGIGMSVVTIDKWYYSLGLAILIALVEQFLEKALFEYTSLVFRPLPEFYLDRTQWLTNGFLIPMEQRKHPGDLAYMGPAYKDKDFAIKLFSYLQTWCGGNVDKDNHVILSFVIEPDERYSTYIYSGTSGKEIEELFIRDAERKKFEKYGKRQQKYVVQHVFWHTFEFKDGYLIKRFLEFQQQNEPFYLTPSVVKTAGEMPEYLFDYSILKYHYKLRKRGELTEHDIEYHMKPVEPVAV
ncbi:MAG: hypothetical protein ACLQQ4_18095 [Bacteroidia bacterium]